MPALIERTANRTSCGIKRIIVSTADFFEYIIIAKVFIHKAPTRILYSFLLV